MSKGGGSSSQPTETKSTVTQSNLPEYARPYYERIMGRAEAESNQPYQTYPDQRLNAFSPDQALGFDMTRDLVTGGVPDANGLAQLMAINSGTQQPSYTGSAFSGGAWSPAAASYYMNPYVDQVADRMSARTNQQFAEGQLNRDARAVNAGAFGGSRHGVLDAMESRDLQDRLSDQQSKLYADAYDKGGQMFTSDAGRDLQAQNYGDLSRRAGAQLQLQGGQLGLQGASTLGALGQQQQELGLQGIQAMLNSGQMQQGLGQQALDIGYTDFQNQRDYERQNIQFLTSVLRGYPMTGSANVTQYETPPNQLGQTAGLGLAGIGLYNQLSK